jgi:hypothetical protein
MDLKNNVHTNKTEHTVPDRSNGDSTEITKKNVIARTKIN